MRFFKRDDDTPKVSAFDAIPVEVQETIIVDATNIINVVRTWPSLVIQSPEQAKAMAEEFIAFAKTAGMKMVKEAVMSGGIEDMDPTNTIESLKDKVPVTIRRMVAEIRRRVTDGTPPEPTAS